MSGTFDAIAEPLRGELVAAAAAWDASSDTARLWNKDASLWTGARREQVARLAGARRGRPRAGPVAAGTRRRRAPRRVHARAAARHGRLQSLSRGARRDLRTAARRPRAPRARLDRSRAGRRARGSVDLDRTLVHRREQVGQHARAEHLPSSTSSSASQEAVGAARPAAHFVAITDPGSKMRDRSRSATASARIFSGVPTHRRALLGAVAVRHWCRPRSMGLDVGALARRARRRWSTLRAERSGDANPGVVARARCSAAAARAGRDKLTLIASPGIARLGAWLEQLVAESTGKNGKGIMPVDREALAARRDYGADRVFVYVRLATAPTRRRTPPSRRSRAPGIPSCASTSPTRTPRRRSSSAGRSRPPSPASVMGINPFDQPDVEASKIETRSADHRRTRRQGALPAETPDRRRRRRARSSPTRRIAARLAASAGGADARRGCCGALRRARAPATTSRCSPTSR